MIEEEVKGDSQVGIGGGSAEWSESEYYEEEEESCTDEQEGNQEENGIGMEEISKIEEISN